MVLLKRAHPYTIIQGFSGQSLVHHVIVLLKMCSNVFVLQQPMYQRPLGLERSEDQIGEMVEDEKKLYKKAKSGEEVRIGMDPLRGVCKMEKKPGVSSSIQTTKMYCCAQFAMQEKSVCCRDVPCLAHMEQEPGPLHPEHLPPSLSAWVLGTQSTSSQEEWTWTVEWTLASSPTQNLWPSENVC